MGDFNEVYKTFFTGHFPRARRWAPADSHSARQVEVECMAYKTP
jgi:hypothetical protein